MGQGCVKLCKGMSIHLIDHRASGQPAVDDVNRCVREFPRNVLAITLPATGVLPAGKDGRLLLLDLCIVLPGDFPGQPVNIFVLSLVDEFDIVLIIFNFRSRYRICLGGQTGSFNKSFSINRYNSSSRTRTKNL